MIHLFQWSVVQCRKRLVFLLFLFLNRSILARLFDVRFCFYFLLFRNGELADSDTFDAETVSKLRGLGAMLQGSELAGIVQVINN